MRIEFHADGIATCPHLRNQAEQSLIRALRRFARRVLKVKVFLWDTNGPRGGVDKGVRVIVELLPSGEVMIREMGSDAAIALSRAVGRVRHAVRKAIQRRNSHCRGNDFNRVDKRLGWSDPHLQTGRLVGDAELEDGSTALLPRIGDATGGLT